MLAQCLGKVKRNRRFFGGFAPGPVAPTGARVYPVYIQQEDVTNMAGRSIDKVSKVARWGNSLGFRIPREGVQRLKLKEGQSVNVRVMGDTITIRRAKGRRRKWTEKELLKGVTPDLCGPDLIPDRAGRELL